MFLHYYKIWIRHCTYSVWRFNKMRLLFSYCMANYLAFKHAIISEECWWWLRDTRLKVMFYTIWWDMIIAIKKFSVIFKPFYFTNKTKAFIFWSVIVDLREIQIPQKLHCYFWHSNYFCIRLSWLHWFG